jgi:hypothetical protein
MGMIPLVVKSGLTIADFWLLNADFEFQISNL